MGVNSAMMNRSTQRELTKLLLQLSETLPQIDFCADEQKNMALDILENVAGKCRQDFSKAVAAKYADTMQALSQIIQITDWHCQSREENIQCHSLCQEIILQLVENLRHEKEIKKDIVFLPYKASMWDSLESVWKAAYEDKEHCNAYVIPIPYADLNPDRSVATWHCERDQYPKYVPTLDWREVDLEKWHPDIIFIHNPYDNYNYITSVESRYYAQNLKHCTNKLVYIPYFVLDEPCTEESVENFVMTAGVLNADKIVVQSEAMRELYINILTKKTEHTDRVYWEKRISGAGSPKIEKVLTSKKEDFNMPETWRRLISGRKVILYNTSLNAYLRNPEHVIRKLTEVLTFFSNQSDVAFWWRPHPLIEATMISMMPCAVDDYRKVRDLFIRNGWGIYDDTPDMNRAIACSDAYYGDGSSMISLYKLTGKPILRELLKNVGNHERRLYSSYIWKEGRKCFFLAMNAMPAACALFEMDLDTDEVSFVCQIPNTGEYKWGYMVVVKVGQKIIIAPYDGEGDFWEFDLFDQCLTRREVTLESRMKFMRGALSFSNVVYWDGSFYFIGSKGLIVQYEIVSGCYYYHTEWVQKLGLDSAQIDQIKTLEYSLAQFENIVYIAVQGSNKILVIDLINMETELYTFSEKFKIFTMSIMNSDTRTFLLCPMNGDFLIKWEAESGEVTKVYIGEEFPYDRPFGACFRTRKGMICLPCLGNDFGFLAYHDVKVAKKRELATWLGITQPNRLEKFTMVMNESDGKYVFALRNSDATLLEIDIDNGNICSHPIIYRGDVQKIRMDSIDLLEDSIMTLADFVCYIKENNHVCSEHGKQEMNVGSNIVSMLIKEDDVYV